MAKGKGKASDVPPATASSKAPATSASKSKANPKNTKKAPAEDDFIVFTNSDKEPKARKPAGPGESEEQLPIGPPKPTPKQIVGGASWTGKLPVNMLSEHCQKQRWEKPVYDTRKTPDGFSVVVSLSCRNPKTKELAVLPPFRLPPDKVSLALRPTALEAKHVAATLALYRVCSMRNLHMMLPPDHRTLWKEFEAMKQVDVKEGRAWMYEPDPFQAQREREEAKVAAEKRRAQVQAAKEKAANEPGASGPRFRTTGGGGGGGGSGNARGWSSVHKVEMGNKTRAKVEELLRREAVWNPHGVKMTAQQKSAIAREFVELGFRPSHIEEATEACRDREETLEWLLIHIPEDDLPRWALPEKYSAGVTVAATDLKREGAIKRLAQSGYSPDLCRRVMDSFAGDEGRAAEELQRLLLMSGADVEADLPGASGTCPDASRGSNDIWEEETAVLEASFGESYSRPSLDVCQIRLESVVNGPEKEVETYVQFRKAPDYPVQVILSIVSAALPAYVKLSILKRALQYAVSLQGEEMKIYFITSWMQENINQIIEKPGKLREVAAVASGASEDPKAMLAQKTAKKRRHPKPIDPTPDARSKEEFRARQSTPAYRKMLSQRATLPAWQVQEEIVQTVAENQVTIISGETGSGKSTQSVQFILDDLYNRGLGKSTNIIVTQPRRISALGLAERVGDERCSPVGQEVGYSIRGESKTSPNTRITFVTTGVLLRRLQTSGGRIEDVVASLADVSHVVVDEVHERSLDTDFLLSILRDVLYQRKDLSVILMSATLDAATFQHYFQADGRGVTVGLVEIAGRTYPVQDYYVDDIIRMTGFSPSRSNDYRADNGGNDRSGDARDDGVNKIVMGLGTRINYDLILDTVKAIHRDLSGTQKSGGILIFLPGVAEIGRACKALRGITSLHVLSLHASLDTREQKKVFAAAPPGKRKVVVATNVAETSITIDDIVAVIDTGRVKETSFDAQNNMRKLEETWASRAACKQRRGRAGRVQAGKCYKLYTRNLEENHMADRPAPEMQRVPLEQLCLAVLAMGVADVEGFLARTPTPPAAPAVEGAVRVLRSMGALESTESPLTLTALGRQMALIPADLRCAKLMVFGAVFGCLHDCVAAAALLSTRSPFVQPPPDGRDAAKAARMRFARGDGDVLTDLRAFQEWDEIMNGAGEGRMRRARIFCDENFLSFQTLSDIASARAQFLSALSELGIVNSNTSSSSSGSMALLRALTASAFSPQIVRIQFPDKKFASSVSGAVELDPEARTIRYYTRDQSRVFVHPGSTLFDSQGFPGNAAFLSYFTMFSTSKVFVRDLTPFNAFTLLLFAGSIELDTQGRGLVVDGWLRLRGWARIGVLVSRLRGVVDAIIARKIENPGADMRDSDKVVQVVTRLIELDGLDA